MIRKILTIAILLTSSAVFAAELKPLNLAPLRFKGDGNWEKDFVLKHFVNKSPRFVFMHMARPLNIRETDSVGLPLWNVRKCTKSTEWLATYRKTVVDERITLEGRHAFSLKLEFYKKDANSPWLCWDAAYRLLPKGVDWHKENEKVSKEKF